jgi:hypothetical protein
MTPPLQKVSDKTCQMGRIANDKMAKPWLTSGKKQRLATMGSREQFVKTLSFRRKTLISFRKTLHCFCAFVSPSSVA